MNVIAEIVRINELELQNGSANTSASWHAKYADSAWVYIGNLPIALTEGDVICIMSQFGEIEDINLVRNDDDGKSKGFAFLKYEDARSCVLAVDNLSGSKVLGRSMRVDHVEQYRLPKHLQEKEEEGNTAPIMTGAGHAYVDKELSSSFNIHKGQDLFMSPREVMQREEMDRAKEAKLERKAERDKKRRENEERRERKEERKRNHTSKKIKRDDSNISDSDNKSDEGQRSSHRQDKKRRKHRKKHY